MVDVDEKETKLNERYTAENVKFSFHLLLLPRIYHHRSSWFFAKYVFFFPFLSILSIDTLEDDEMSNKCLLARSINSVCSESNSTKDQLEKNWLTIDEITKTSFSNIITASHLLMNATPKVQCEKTIQGFHNSKLRLRHQQRTHAN